MASPLKFDGGLTCALQVKDFQAALKWYQEILGFQVLYQMDEMGWAELQTETPKVNVGISQVENPTMGGGATLTFGVEDIDAARKQLEAKDVRFDGPTRTIEGMVKLATFYDPSGNQLMLYQSLTKQ